MLRVIHSKITDFRIRVTFLFLLICSQAGLMARQVGSETSGTTFMAVVVQPAAAAVKMCYTWKAERSTSTAY